MAAGRYSFVIEQGATLDFEVQYKDSNNDPIDLSGYTGQDRRIEIGSSRQANGYSYIDLIGDTTYSDFGARFIRENGGPNTGTAIEHRGTGVLSLNAKDAGSVRFYTSNSERVRIDSSANMSLGNVSDQGAKLRLYGVNAGNWNDGLIIDDPSGWAATADSYTHLRAHETKVNIVCRLLLENKKDYGTTSSIHQHQPFYNITLFEAYLIDIQ